MTRFHETRHRLVTTFQRRSANPVTRHLPTQVLLETTGSASACAGTGTAAPRTC